MKTQKNLSLLRPFNLELAKAGEPICRFDDNPLLFIGVGTKQIGVEHKKTNVIASYSEYDLRMAPLTWIEGKPVYKGDILWYKGADFSIRVSGYNSRVDQFDAAYGGLEGTIANKTRRYEINDTIWANYGAWTWEAPQKEYWYRLALVKQWDGEPMTITVDSNRAGGYTEASVASDPGFIKFLSERVYYRY